MMAIRSYCYIINKATELDAGTIRKVIFQERLCAKSAILKSVGGRCKVEVVVADEGTMKFIATLFEKRTGDKLVYVELPPLPNEDKK